MAGIEYNSNYVPASAIRDAQKLKQWKPGNICFGDSYFSISCANKYGLQVWKRACSSVSYIPIPHREYCDR